MKRKTDFAASASTGRARPEVADYRVRGLFKPLARSSSRSDACSPVVRSFVLTGFKETLHSPGSAAL